MASPGAGPDLRLTDIYAGYGGGDVLKGLSLTVQAGSLTCVVGPNGAGKSTLVAVVSGLIRPRLGRVTFGGDQVSGASARHIIKLGICQVPQARSLFPHMSVRENVELGGIALHDRSLTRHRRTELEERFPLLRERAREAAGNLSGGQQRLVEIARSLMLEPKLLVLDEPSAGLEPRIASEVYSTIEALHLAGTTVLLVEQNVRAGLRLATHGIVLEGGRVRHTGSGAGLLQDGTLAALYLGGRPQQKDAADPGPARVAGPGRPPP